MTTTLKDLVDATQQLQKLSQDVLAFAGIVPPEQIRVLVRAEIDNHEYCYQQAAKEYTLGGSAEERALYQYCVATGGRLRTEFIMFN